MYLSLSTYLHLKGMGRPYRPSTLWIHDLSEAG